MKAVVFDTYGGPEVLHAAEIPAPNAGPGQVRLAVRAAGYNPLDAKIRSGMLQAVMPIPLPACLGSDVAGVVDQVGEGVTGLAVGDEVLGWADSGSYAEYALASTVAPKPAALSWESAAALPVASETAERVLTFLGVASGETLLIHGAAGAVGAMAVQLAVQRGTTVIGTASAANHEYLRGLGATPVQYGEGLVERVRAVAPHGVDAVLDAAGKDALPASIELRGSTSRIVTIADMSAQGLGIPFSGGTPATRSAEALTAIAQQVAAGKIEVIVSQTFALAEAAQAHRAAESGHGRGKIVLTVD